MEKINEIKSLISNYASKLEAPKDIVPSFESTDDFVYRSIEIDNKGNYNYVLVESGIEIERKVFSNEKELLFEIFENVTFIMASSYEYTNQIKIPDFTASLLSKQEELLGLLDKNWSIIQKERNLRYLA